MQKKITWSNIRAYIWGNIVYQLYYSPFSFLIPNYIAAQIALRILTMNVDCYVNGSCVMCGCRTTQLQMAFKPCEGKCYPKMLSLKQWRFLNKYKVIHIDNVLWKTNNNKFEEVKHEMDTDIPGDS